MRRSLLLLGAGLVLGACDSAGPDLSAAAPATASTSQGAVLATVRRATAPYHHVERAVADGWGAVVISECVAVEPLGGMGHHYVNLGLLDGHLDPAAPEVLLYEPMKNGRLRLVAVEYIVPFAVVSEAGPAPRLFGQTFVPSDAAGGWALHVWAWRNNPSGLFADFNPHVSCEYAS